MRDEKEQSATDASNASGDHYWDRLCHEDSLFSNRINFFLIAESMLLIAFAINAYKDPNLTKILGAAGILFVAIWMYVSVVHVYFHINPIKQKLRIHLPEYREVKDVGFLGDPNIWLGIVFPIILILIWIFLMIGD